MKQTEKLENLTPSALSVLPKEITKSLPLQAIEVIKTIKKLKRTDGKQDWQGYMIKFIDSNVVIPIEGGLILASSKEAFKTNKVKEVTHYELIATEMGYDVESKRFFTTAI